MEQIKIIENIKINEEQFDLRYQFKIPIPAPFIPLTNKVAILKSYQIQYPSLFEVDDENVTFIDKTTFTYLTSVEDIKSELVTKYNTFQSILNTLPITNADQMNSLIFNGTTWQ